MPEKNHLRNRKDFLHCYRHGRCYHSAHFLLFVAKTENSGKLRTGLAVSRKVGKAVVRNRIKRLLRECFRLHLALLTVGADIAVVAKKHASDKLTLHTVEKELLPLFALIAK